MKKYIKPVIVEVKLDNEAILAASITPYNEVGGGEKLANDFDDLDWDEE